MTRIVRVTTDYFCHIIDVLFVLQQPRRGDIFVAPEGRHFSNDVTGEKKEQKMRNKKKLKGIMAHPSPAGEMKLLNCLLHSSRRLAKLTGIK
jgi:hypothetical protein